MKLEIHWPVGSGNYVVYGYVTYLTNMTSSSDLNDFLEDVTRLSFYYDVIIDNGKITFVDKE